MAFEDERWEQFYQKNQGREPRPILLNVLEQFAAEPVQRPRKAIDLGCGDGTESILLLEHGWHVFAIDGHPAGIARLMAKVPPEHQSRLQSQVAKFEEVALSPADLVFASYSLPFCHPTYFPTLWDQIVDTIVPGGRFAGQFFGVRDSWAVNTDMTFHTEEEARAKFASFEIESFNEQDEDGESTIGPKHWHVFTVIAKKR